jgi:hypothetical protein
MRAGTLALTVSRLCCRTASTEVSATAAPTPPSLHIIVKIRTRKKHIHRKVSDHDTTLGKTAKGLFECLFVWRITNDWQSAVKKSESQNELKTTDCNMDGMKGDYWRWADLVSSFMKSEGGGGDVDGAASMSALFPRRRAIPAPVFRLRTTVSPSTRTLCCWPLGPPTASVELDQTSSEALAARPCTTWCMMQHRCCAISDVRVGCARNSAMSKCGAHACTSTQCTVSDVRLGCVCKHAHSMTDRECEQRRVTSFTTSSRSLCTGELSVRHSV